MTAGICFTGFRDSKVLFSRQQLRAAMWLCVTFVVAVTEAFRKTICSSFLTETYFQRSYVLKVFAITSERSNLSASS